MVTKKQKNQKREKYQEVVIPVLIGLVLTLIIGFFIVSNIRIEQKRSSMLKEIEDLEQEIGELEQKNADLKSGISNTQTDVYWEERSREQGYIKEGEEAVVVIPPENKLKEEEKEQSFWESLKEKFGL